MSDNRECVMSCDPANPRRSPVPGLESVKSATEDTTGVSNQAPVPVNVTGKRLVQQAFHPSLFISRSRSPSISSPPCTSKEEPYTQKDQQSQCLDPEPIKSTSTQPPNWQRVPLIRNPKRKKIANSPSPDKMEISNSFSGLTVDLTDEQIDEPKIKKPNKPPPIILYGVEDLNKLTELLESVTEKSQFSYKIINRNQLKILTCDIEIYKLLISVIRENGLIGHTFNRKDNRNYRIVIRNLHHTTPFDAIKAAIEETGNTVTGEIINAKFGPDKKPTTTFFANLLSGPNNKAVKSIKVIYHQTVIIEDPRKRKTIVQCQRCQQYGHTKNYCMKPFRCVKCAGAHKTSECTKTDRNTPAMCALCLGPHPANYKGCEVYKEILTRKTYKYYPRKQRNDHKVHKEDNMQEHPINLNSAGNRPPHTQNAKTQEKTYAEATNSKPDKPGPDTRSSSYKTLENMFIKQSEKIDLLLQQMSTLLQLITTLISNSSK
ncbi:unnamed protein product [Euphydryas editha]|uniref:Pre-C2HC domain-containing protein n=1 Tax=Euphydryas editha TaxID=104508 RepID=A0AAU9V1B1_EUPED|nr:unnamed protein product [Euphydryas editha]